MQRSKEHTKPGRLWTFVRNNLVSIIMLAGIVVLYVNPDAKSFVLRQLMKAGLFNAGISKKEHFPQQDIDFYFEDEDDTAYNTASLRGKVVFINFWASWCPPCRAEFPSIEALYAKFKNNPNVFFLTINMDEDITAAKAYLQKQGYTVPLWFVKNNVPGAIYSGTLPTTVVLDKQGAIRLHTTGFANYASAKFIQQMEELIEE